MRSSHYSRGARRSGSGAGWRQMIVDFYQHSLTALRGGWDIKLIAPIALLVFIGLIALSSAGVALGWQKFGDSYWYVKHQIALGLIPGLALFLFFSFLPYQKLRAWASWMFAISIGLLVLVFIPGIGADWGTSRSWINFFGFSLQPSEIVKLTFLIYLAAWLSARDEEHLQDFKNGVVPFLSALAIVAVLMMLQPDTGTMMIIVGMSLIIFFVGGGQLKHVMGIIAVGFLGILALIKMSPYRTARLTTFLHPELDPQGIGYHINQALLAVGSGSWFGRGYGHSRQKFAYLPEVTGDSIFAVVSEEMGFVVTSLIIVLLLYIFWRGIELAKRATDPFARLVVVGIIAWFAIQSFFNIGAIVGILPLTGVPLPFISYGGTALITCLAATGILVNIAKQFPDHN